MDEDKRGIVNELHRAARKNFKRRKVYVKGIDDLWQIDLVEMQPYSKVNSGHKYILTVIDVLSKYAWAVPVVDKTGKKVAAAMKSVFDKVRPKHSVPRNVQSDLGSEFYNQYFKSLMTLHGINHYSTFTHLKASVVERFNRTLKGWMWKEFGVQGNYKWLKLLPNLLERYNSTVHLTIGMRPKDVKPPDEERLVKLLNRPNTALRRSKSRLSVGDVVRVSKYKTLFAKGFTPSWSTELFTIDSVRRTRPPVYYLRDDRGNTISGAFYEEELQKTKYPDTFLVERVLRRKGGKALVRWLGMDSSHDSWI